MKAAVPNYLGTRHEDAAPGHRFNLYFEIWRDDWTLADKDKANAFKRTLEVRPTSKLLAAWLERQSAQAAALGAERVLSLTAQSIAPFATGLGNEHPLENGFAFLNPYGLPYLAGSGVKGVLRRAAQELASGDWGDSRGWSEERTHAIRIGQETVPLSTLDVLFGREPANGDTHHARGVLSFWDVIPQLAGDRLHVEIMTPHQTHYYQHGQSPHESGQPNPICFLAVPPRSGFTFHVAADLLRLRRLAPELGAEERWKALLQAAFAHAFDWLGFGAKTAVGFGAMARDREAEEREARERAEQEARAAEASRRAAMTENFLKVEDFIGECDRRLQALNGGKERQNTGLHQRAQQLTNEARESGAWTAGEKQALADAMTEWLPKLVERFDKAALKKLKLAELRNQP